MLVQCWVNVVDGGPTLGQRLVFDGKLLKYTKKIQLSVWCGPVTEHLLALNTLFIIQLSYYYLFLHRLPPDKTTPTNRLLF